MLSSGWIGRASISGLRSSLRNLTREQKADLKRKFTNTNQLNKAEQKVKRSRWISACISGTTGRERPTRLSSWPDKATALLYKKYLDESAWLLRSAYLRPYDREGNEEVDESTAPAVQQFGRR